MSAKHSGHWDNSINADYLFGRFVKHAGHQISIEKQSGADAFPFEHEVEIYPIKVIVKCQTCGERILVLGFNEEVSNESA